MSERRGSLVFLVLSAAALAAGASCAQIIGLEPFEGTGGAAGATGASSRGVGGGGAGGNGGAGTGNGGGGGCGPHETCVALPDKWSGPVFVEPGTACASGDAEAMLTVAPACASCTCEPDVTCEFVIYLAQTGGTSCTPGNFIQMGGDVGCNMLPATPTGALVDLDAQMVPGASCQPHGACTAPAPQTIVLCPTGPACPGGACASASTPACVYADASEATCPNGFTDDRGLAYDALLVSPDCLCGPPQDVDCNDDNLTLYSDDGCTMGAKGWKLDKCFSEGTERSVKYTPNSPGTCDSPHVQIAGQSGAKHVCCAP